MTDFSPGDLVCARGREWVVLPERRSEVFRLRPLMGNENDIVVLNPKLELTPIKSASFDLPTDAVKTEQSKAVLLADALRMTLRRGVGPFRSAANLSFEPRTYQLVPLLMALRLETPRLLIADDVGIGKTIEAGLILRELMDRGEVDAFSVLCAPHLVEQWTTELEDKFGIEAVAVTASSAARLERNLPVNQSLFDAYPHTVVSLDYIKADRRRDNFARSCSDFVIVDEAHSCVGTHKGKQQRFELLRLLAEDSERRLIMLTATPHSGDEDAFGRLLSLIHTDFESMEFGEQRYREKLARHFVQRQRIDLTEGDWDEGRSFPQHETTELSYRLSNEHISFHEDVLNYCFSVVSNVEEGKNRQRLAFWSMLALMRCVGSSPAAALSALNNRLTNLGEKLESRIYDEDGDDEDAMDVEPSITFSHDEDLEKLVDKASNLIKSEDPKLKALIENLKPLIGDGANPVIFCRYIATANYIKKKLEKEFAKITTEIVTGEQTPEERRDRVARMVEEKTGVECQRLLVATDCLSEGINLQQFFDVVIHYDLSWNPTRHQQREGRVDRFGQLAPLVRSVMIYSPDSAIDGAVLDVILRKAADIHRATGVTVPLPDSRGPMTEALMNAVLLRRKDAEQIELDLQYEDALGTVNTYWKNAKENEKRSRAIFAQNAMKPEQVKPEWRRTASLLGTPKDAHDFVARSMSCFGVPLERKKSVVIAHIEALDPPIKERLEERGLRGSVRLAMIEPVPSGATLLSRTNVITSSLAECLLEASLDKTAMPSLGIGRVGAWLTEGVSAKTILMLLRIRFRLTVHSRKEKFLLAEEAAVVAIRDGKVIVSGDDARTLLDIEAAADIDTSTQDRLIASAMTGLPDILNGPIREFVSEREEVLLEDHVRFRSAAAATPRVSVDAVNPPDTIGLFILLPSRTYQGD